MFRKIQNAISSYLTKKFKFEITYEKEFTRPRGKTKVEIIALDKKEDLNYVMLDKFLESIDEMIVKSQKANVSLEIEFKDSILTCKNQNDIIALQSIQPKDSMGWEEVAIFDNKALPLRQYLYDNVLTNQDIVELEKTMIRLI